jgi:hypothetical protein
MLYKDKYTKHRRLQVTVSGSELLGLHGIKKGAFLLKRTLCLFYSGFNLTLVFTL